MTNFNFVGASGFLILIVATDTFSNRHRMKTPKDFSQVEIPKGIFLRGDFPNKQFFKEQLLKSALATRVVNRF